MITIRAPGLAAKLRGYALRGERLQAVKSDIVREVAQRARVEWVELADRRLNTSKGAYLEAIGDVDTRYNYELRQQALKSWTACAPTDGMLLDQLLTTVKNDILSVQTTAMELLGTIKNARAIPVLEETAARPSRPGW